MLHISVFKQQRRLRFFNYRIGMHVMRKITILNNAFNRRPEKQVTLEAYTFICKSEG